MNINMLRDTDNDAGFYAAACGATDKWRGALLYSSSDAGASYQSIATISVESTIGVVAEALADFGGGNIPDELNKLTVTLTNGTLSSTDFAGLIAGVNAALIGDELVYFRDATLVSEGVYTISGFLRGRRGSEYAMTTHATNDRFVLLSPSTLIRVPQVTADIGMTRLYKAVTNGLTLASTSSQSFTNSGAGLKPYAAVLLGGGRDVSGNAIINWTRRTRISGEWRDSVDVPIGEDHEEYVVEIWNSDYSTLKRTITGLTSPTTTYSAADQTTDFGSPQSTIYFRVYQLSVVVGRGYAADGSV